MTTDFQLLQMLSQMPLADLDQLPLLELEHIIQQVDSVKSTIRHYDTVVQSALNRTLVAPTHNLSEVA